MKEENEIEDETLGRWLAGELNETEKEEFEKSEAFQSYQAIAHFTEDLELEPFKTELSYEQLKEKLNGKSNETKVVKMPVWKRLAAAASIAVILGLGLTYFLQGFGDYPTTVLTAQGETKSLTLPDQSEVMLNISSKIEYDEDNWEDERAVHLSGEAYFKVSKGNRFVVNTEHGTVEVLGTEFNIRNRQQQTEVICYEGKVRVTDLKGQSTVLVPTDAARLIDGELETNWSPSVNEKADWQNGVSSFHEVPMSNVIEELENQYQLQVQMDSEHNNRNYVGAFPHDNLEDALDLICNPMQLKYTIQNDSLIVIK